MSGVGGAVPTSTMLDYLRPEINRPDLYSKRAYPLSGGGGGSSLKSVQKDKADTTERSPAISLYYTLGLIVLSALLFLTIGAWANAMLSWLDSIYVSPVIRSVTQARIQFAWIMTGISMIVISMLLFLWYEFTINRDQ